MATNLNVVGTSANDVLTGGAGNDLILGLDGDDRIVVTAGNDTYDGGAGFDTLDGSAATKSLNIDLEAGTLDGIGHSRLTGFEALIGSPKADTITGSGDADVISAGGGNDQINGGAGDDQLAGGTGNDTIGGGDGQDVIHGDDGNDTLSGGAGDDMLSGDAGTDRMDGGDGNDTLSGGAGGDTLTGGTGDDTIFGDDGNDTIAGGDGIDKLSGGTGTDTINGGAGDDIIEGGDGSDILHGNDGNDILVAGAGGDKLYGDAGNDTLVYTASAGQGFTQTFDGGSGTDTLEIHLNQAQLTPAVQAELARFEAFLANPLNAGHTFTFSALGSLKVSNIESLKVIVDDANTAPTIDQDASTLDLSVTHGQAVDGQIVATDAEGNPLTYSVAAGPQHGSLVFTDAQGHYTYTGGDFVGSDTFTLQVDDGHGGVTTQVITVELTNSGPVVDAEHSTLSLAASRATPVTGVVAVADAEGDTLTYALAAGPQHGTVTLTDDTGHYTYVSDGTAGLDSFTLQVSDGHGGVVTQVVDVAVTGAVTAHSLAQAVNVDLALHTASNVDGDVNWAIDATGSNVADVLRGDARDNVLSGGGGNDNLAGNEGNDTLSGGDGNDSLNGGGSRDVLYGDAGADTLYGGGADDRLSGGDGNDKIYGDGGNDIMSGGAGNDILTGGQQNGLGINGADTFAWQRNDVVSATGTSLGFDHITDFGANDRLDFTGLFDNSHPADLSAVLHVTDTSSGTLVQADVGGGHFVDVVLLDNVHMTFDDLINNHQVVV
jgi:Ca2+-binding RTX toxin-like protein